jgi:cytidylate kinase
MTSIEAIIDRQLRRWELESNIRAAELTTEEKQQRHQPIITISRQRGSGGSLIARKLAGRFNYTLLHRDIIDRIVESTGYKRRIVESLDEHSQSQLETWFASMVAGKCVDGSDYAKHLLEIIYSISQLGGVVVIGRGANFIVGHDLGFHIRVVAPRAERIHNLMQYEGLSEKEAAKAADASDHDRSEFVKKTFGKSIDDPLYYDLVINHLTISIETATSLIATAAMEKFALLRNKE